MSAQASIAHRLEQLSARLASSRQGDLRRYSHFFSALGARVETARAVEHELDRLLARRFNALHYLRTDEHGLSRIVADLLDPRGTHGQGTLFLAVLLGLDRFRNALSWPVLDPCRITVVTERRIADERRIDISVEIADGDEKRYCLAIENKPYAADQPNQVEDYLRFLKDQYKDRFLLAYLSPNGKGPSDWSIRKKELQSWKERFAIMAYAAGPAESGDEFEEMRISSALTDWLRECRKTCDVDRLRWFLREVETFCDKKFGGTVTTTSEREEVKDFILANDDNVRTAIAVIEAWPETRDEVVRRFLTALRNQVAQHLGEFADLQIESGFENKCTKDGIWVYRPAWSTDGGTLYSIWLGHDGGAKNWWVGVSVEDSNAEERLKEPLRRAMQGGDSGSKFPWYRYLDEHKDWSPLVARLHEESRNAGKLMDYFSRRYVEVAEAAVPIIDKVLANR